MGFYRRIDVRMHGDARFLALSKPNPNGQTLFERMIHGPFSNSIGLYQAGRLAMAESLGWSPKGFDKAFAEVLANGMAIYCEEHRVLYLPNFLKHNPPGSTNVAKNWVKLIDSLPECHLVNDWIQQFKAFAEAFPQAFRVALPDAVATAYRTTPSPSPSPSPTPELHCEAGASRQGAQNGQVAKDILTWLNEKAGRNFHADDTNLGFIKARLKDGILPEQLKAIVSRKVRQWQGTDQAMYLRPATLFNKTKCSQYLGELPKIEEDHADNPVP